MGYQEFKEKMMEALKEVFPEGQGYRLLTEDRDGKEYIQIRQKDNRVTSEMTMQNLYQMTELSGSLSSVAEMVQETVTELEQITKIVERVKHIDLENYESVKGSLQVELVRAEQNGAFLSDGIYERKNIGALVPYVIVSEESREAYARVTSQMLEAYGVSREELMKQAMENTRAENPPHIRRFYMEQGGITCYEVTNRKDRSGATAILYPGVMEELRQKIGTDYYVVPFNARGVIAIGKDQNITADELRKVLLETNRGAGQEWLSSRIFEYKSSERALSVCRREHLKKMER